MISFGLAAIFTIVASCISLYTFLDSKNSIKAITNKNIPELSVAHDLAFSAQLMASKALYLIGAKTQSSRQTVSDLINDEVKGLDKHIDKLEEFQVKGLEDLKEMKKNC